MEDKTLVERLAAEDRVLALVNTCAHTAKLYSHLVRAIGQEGCFYLSTRMCGAHCRDMLRRVREAASTGPCRVVSTQLIEAGVDLDLPVVYRAEAGLDFHRAGGRSM